MVDTATPRFLALTEVAEVLSISVSQAYALVRRGDLPAIKIGGRGQWRVEASELENYIAQAYRSTRQFINDHPFVGEEVADGEPEPLPASPSQPAPPGDRPPDRR